MVLIHLSCNHRSGFEGSPPSKPGLNNEWNWTLLRCHLQKKFWRQEQIGRFIADFVCYEKMLIVEADGGQHAQEKEKDEERTLWLNGQGVTVLRFWNHEILSNSEGVLEMIGQRCL